MRTQVRYSGRVQGVGFRATARDCARRWPVTGWVRNEPDGSVLLEIQGDPHAVQGALTDIRKAMAGNIRNEQTTPLPDAPGETGFDILR